MSGRILTNGHAAVLGDVRRRAGVLLVLVATFAAVLLLQEPARAGESFTWTGEGKDGGSWTNACNWWPEDQCQEKYPGKENPDDTALIGEGAVAHVSLNENLTLDSLILENGSLTGGSVRLNRSLGWTAGTLATNVTVSAGAGGTIDGRATKVFDGTLDNRGHLSLGPDATLNLTSGTKVNNFGTFTAQHGARIAGLTCCVTPPEINNTGTFVVGPAFIPLPGAESVTVTSASFNAGGIVNVSRGTLELRQAPSRISAATRFTGDGTFRISDKADVMMLGAFSVSRTTDVKLDSCDKQCGGGALRGTGSIMGEGNFLWTGGEVEGSLTLGPQIETFVSGPAIKSLSDGRITNLGRVVLSASAPDAPPAGELSFGPGDRFENRGAFVADERASIVGRSCCTSPAVFDNPGYFGVAPGGSQQPGAFTAKGISFQTNGRIHVDRGLLELRQGLGTLSEGLRVTGGGAVRVTDRTTMGVSGALDFAPGSRLELDSCSNTCGYGVLAGKGTFGGGGRFDWLGGAVDESGVLTVEQGSTMRLVGPAPKELRGQVTNVGTAYFLSNPAPAPASGPLVFVGPAGFVNDGNFVAGDRAVLKGTVCCANPAKFVNRGRFSVPSSHTPSTGTARVDGLVFENRGTTELAAGELGIGAGRYLQLAGETRLVGGRMRSVNQVDLLGGTLTGAGTITGNVRNPTGGTVAPGVAGSTGIIRIAGDYFQGGGVLVADLKGTTPGRQFDQLQVTGRALYGSGATLDINTASGFAPTRSTRLPVLTAGVRQGQYTTLKDAPIPGGRTWYAIYPPNGVTLGVR